jgi:hypothetical protein
VVGCRTGRQKVVVPSMTGKSHMAGHGSKFGRKMEAAIAALLTHRTTEEAACAVGICKTNSDPLAEDTGIPICLSGGAQSSHSSRQRTAAICLRRSRIDADEDHVGSEFPGIGSHAGGGECDGPCQTRHRGRGYGPADHRSGAEECGAMPRGRCSRARGGLKNRWRYGAQKFLSHSSAYAERTRGR